MNESDNMISKEDVKLLLSYMDSASNYDKLSILHLASLSFILWGFIFYVSGLIDYLFESLGKPMYAILIWFINSFFGAIFYRLTSARELSNKDNNSDEVKNFSNRKASGIVLFSMVISWIITFLLAFIGNDEYILVAVPFNIGLIFLLILSNIAGGIIPILKNIRFYSREFPQMIASFFSALINLIFVLIFGSAFDIYDGLSMGIVVGTGFMYSGIKNYQQYMMKIKNLNASK